MPTDGADFGRMKACYGSAYTAARYGADNGQIAETVGLGLERDIRRDGGAPAFLPAVDLLVLVSNCSIESRSGVLFEGVDRLNREFAESPFTRHVADAVQKLGVAAIAETRELPRQEAAEFIAAHLARSRCCDRMTPYLTKNRTQSVMHSYAIVNSISSMLKESSAIKDFAARMLNASERGLPAKAPKAPRIEHSASVLNNMTLEGGI